MPEKQHGGDNVGAAMQSLDRPPKVPKVPEDDKERWQKWMKGPGGLTLDIPVVKGPERIFKGWYGLPSPGRRFFNPNSDPWKPLSKSPEQSPLYRRHWSVEDSLEVPAALVSKIIGPQGQTIARITEDSGCKVVVEQVQTRYQD